LAPEAKFSLAGLAARGGNLSQAAAWLDGLLTEHPRASVVSAALFNRAALREKNADLAGAQVRWLEVVDHSPTAPIAGLAYWRIGRAYLTNGSGEDAIRPLRKGMECKVDSIRAASSMGVAAALLLTDDPKTAHAALSTSRKLIAVEPYRSTAATLDALARFRMMARPTAAITDDLLSSLLNRQPDVILGPVGVLLAGQAYRDLGLPEQMASLYTVSLPGVRGSLAIQMHFAIGSYARSIGDARKAQTHLAAVTSGPSAAQAAMQLASLALSERRARACLTHCRAALSFDPPADRSSVLATMGRAYEMLGDNLRATRCFAGELPAP
jgi:tetratricopeptide (TPR) repeat protein